MHDMFQLKRFQLICRDFINLEHDIKEKLHTPSNVSGSRKNYKGKVITKKYGDINFSMKARRPYPYRPFWGL